MSSSLFDDIRACRSCEGLPLGPKPLFQAATGARILIAGQAPGRVTHERGRPFDDVSGDRLRSWLGVERASFYNADHFAIVPMGFCYPGTGKSGDLPPRPECAATWREPLLGALPNLSLTLILGRFALGWHLPGAGKRTLGSVVAEWQDYWPEVLPLPHPSPRNQRWFKQHPFFEAEVLPALRERVRDLLGEDSEQERASESV